MEQTLNETIQKASTALKDIKEIKAPEWAAYVKTGRHKERPPIQKDWWYIRSAAVLCAVQKLGPVGVSKLRTKYGGKKNRGYKTEHQYKGSGSIIRHVLQQLETVGFIAQNKKGKAGRIITPKGLQFLAKCQDGSRRAPPKADGRVADAS
ncbi:MAG: 30S ribosomal protein S19e [Nanoarchaeota archaeon]